MTSDDEATEPPQKAQKTYSRHLLSYGRLEPQTEWTGGRITDTDLLSLDEAAAMATRHSGEHVNANDFLRAGGRGEIRLLAIVRRSTVMLPLRQKDGPLKVPFMSIPPLPLQACQHLANVGIARWRTLDVIERDDETQPFFYQSPRWKLPDGEADFEAVMADCRVKGYDTHALADAFKQTDSADASIATSQPGRRMLQHTFKRVAVLDDVINEAKKDAVDRDNALSVWVALREMAEKPNRPLPLVGFSQGEVKYRVDIDGDEVIKSLSFDALRMRMRREKAKRTADPER